LIWQRCQQWCWRKTADAEETYVRRRRWSWAEKRAVIEEAAASGNVIGTAKRHGIQAQQIYRWRERFAGRLDPPGFAAVSVVVDAPKALPAPMPDSHPLRRLVRGTSGRLQHRLGLRLQAVQVGDSALRVRSCLEDRPLVIGEDAKPASKVRGMVRPWFQLGDNSEIAQRSAEPISASSSRALSE